MRPRAQTFLRDRGANEDSETAASQAGLLRVQGRRDPMQNHEPRLKRAEDLVVLQLGGACGGIGAIRTRLAPVDGDGLESLSWRAARCGSRRSEPV